MTERRAGSNPTDSQLIAAAKLGDIEAFGALVARHQTAAVRVAAIALGSTANADDVAQEAFVKAQRALPRFRIEAAFRPWLFRIVTNTARNRQRSDNRHRALTLRDAALNPDRRATGDDALAERAARVADREVLIDAINRLRPDDRLLLTYRWYEEMTEREISEALGCRPGTVKSRLNRAMKRLRSELGELGGLVDGASDA